jgi:hypothetical protein
MIFSEKARWAISVIADRYEPCEVKDILTECASGGDQDDFHARKAAGVALSFLADPGHVLSTYGKLAVRSIVVEKAMNEPGKPGESGFDRLTCIEIALTETVCQIADGGNWEAQLDQTGVDTGADQSTGDTPMKTSKLNMESSRGARSKATTLDEARASLQAFDAEVEDVFFEIALMREIHKAEVDYIEESGKLTIGEALEWHKEQDALAAKQEELI